MTGGCNTHTTTGGRPFRQARTMVNTNRVGGTGTPSRLGARPAPVVGTPRRVSS